jgi:hypothetical protein
MAPLKLALWPDLYLGEAYMNGSLVLERGDLWDLLDLCRGNHMEDGHSKSGYLGPIAKSPVSMPSSNDLLTGLFIESEHDLRA